MGIRGLPASYGGLETCAEEVTRFWAGRGYDVLVYCRKSHYESRPEQLGAVRLKYTSSIPSKSLDTLSHTFFSIIDLLVNERDVKFVHLYNTGNAILLPILKLFGKRIVVSGDGLEWKREKWGVVARLVHKIGERMAVMFSDAIAVDNEAVREYYIKNYSTEVSLIAYGAKLMTRDPERSAEVLEKFGLVEKQYFLFVGRLVPEKGVHELIRAYRKLDTDLPLVIVGDDVNKTPYRNGLFKQQADDVRFLGFVYGAEYEQLLVNALIYVSASSLEGTSPSLLAAMGARVCTLVNGIQENRASVGDAALMFAENNFEELGLKWQSLIDGPPLLADLAQRGYEHVVKNYGWDAIAERYLALFGRIA